MSLDAKTQRNLEVLGSFLGDTNVRVMIGGASKLQIVDGAFSKVTSKDITGFFFGNTKRSKIDSLLNDTVLSTIMQQFTNAVAHMDAVDSDKKHDETQRLIFKGLHGLIYLGYMGNYKTRADFSKFKVILKSIIDLVYDRLIKAIKSGDCTPWYGQPKFDIYWKGSMESFNIPKDDNGWCFGISLNWCRRYLKKDKQSWLDRSKVDLIDETHNQNLMTHKLNLKEYDKRIKWEEAKTEPNERSLAENRDKRNTTLKSIRGINAKAPLIKKGKYTLFTQNIQTEVRAGGSNNIGDAIKTANDFQKGNNNPLLKDILLTLPRDDERAENLATAAAEYDTTKLAAKFDKMKVSEGHSVKLNDFRLKTAEEFKEGITTLITGYKTSQLDGIKRACFINWASQEKYDYENNSGHAMAFHEYKNSNGIGAGFIAHDPNFGEVLCNGETELIRYFSVLFSFYSISTNINRIYTQYVSLSP